MGISFHFQWISQQSTHDRNSQSPKRTNSRPCSSFFFLIFFFFEKVMWIQTRNGNVSENWMEMKWSFIGNLFILLFFHFVLLYTFLCPLTSLFDSSVVQSMIRCEWALSIEYRRKRRRNYWMNCEQWIRWQAKTSLKWNVCKRFCMHERWMVNVSGEDAIFDPIKFFRYRERIKKSLFTLTWTLLIFYDPKKKDFSFSFRFDKPFLFDNILVGLPCSILKCSIIIMK